MVEIAGDISEDRTMALPLGGVEDIFFVMEVLVLFDREEMNWRATFTISKLLRLVPILTLVCTYLSLGKAVEEHRGVWG